MRPRRPRRGRTERARKLIARLNRRRAEETERRLLGKPPDYCETCKRPWPAVGHWSIGFDKYCPECGRPEDINMNFPEPRR